MTWETRPEALTVTNPHNMRHGRAMHTFVKHHGDWVCIICRPEIEVKPGPPLPRTRGSDPASSASVGRQIPSPSATQEKRSGRASGNEFRHAAETRNRNRRRS